MCRSWNPTEGKPAGRAQICAIVSPAVCVARSSRACSNEYRTGAISGETPAIGPRNQGSCIVLLLYILKAMRLLVLASLASAIVSAQSAQFVVAGCVWDAMTGLPIRGVELAFYSVRNVVLTLDSVEVHSSKKTDSFGNFRIENLAAGDYQLSLTKVGYVGSNYSEPERITVGAGTNSQDLTLRLTPTATMQGRVLDAQDHPVPDVYLHAERQGFAPIRAVSGKDGGYRFENLAPGAYRIVVRVPYATRKKSIERDPETGAIHGYPNSQY
jgi:hypothetical protein